MNFSEQVVSTYRDSIWNILPVLYNQEGAGHTWGQTFWPNEWKPQRNTEDRAVGESKTRREGGTSVIHYKGVSETQTQVQSTRIFYLGPSLNMEMAFYHKEKRRYTVNEDLPDDSAEEDTLKSYLKEGSKETVAANPGKHSCKHLKQFLIWSHSKLQ